MIKDGIDEERRLVPRRVRVNAYRTCLSGSGFWTHIVSDLYEDLCHRVRHQAYL